MSVIRERRKVEIKMNKQWPSLERGRGREIGKKRERRKDGCNEKERSVGETKEERKHESEWG